MVSSPAPNVLRFGRHACIILPREIEYKGATYRMVMDAPIPSLDLHRRQERTMRLPHDGEPFNAIVPDHMIS